MSTYRMDLTDMDESPPTIAYTMLVMLAAVFDCDYAIEDDGYDEYIVMKHGEHELARLQVSSGMGQLLVSILNVTNQELAWTSLN